MGESFVPLFAAAFSHFSFRQVKIPQVFFSVARWHFYDILFIDTALIRGYFI
jgi:hypothetical protein